MEKPFAKNQKSLKRIKKEIKIEKYCEQVSSECDKEKANVVPEQVMEAIGGIANLYLEATFRKGKAQMEVETWETFVCEYVSLLDILEEIGNCAGTNKYRSNIILQKMQKVFSDYFRKYEIFELGEAVLFKPLGWFHVRDLEKSLYILTYNDPAIRKYQKFLL